MTEVNPLEAQIAALQQQLAEQKAALEQQGVAAHEMPSDKEMVHQAVGEQIQSQVPQYVPQPPPSTGGSVAPSDDTPSYMTPELQQHVQDLVNIAFTKGMDDALKVIAQSKNDALTDAFHDVIVDELLKEMVERGKLPKLPE